MPEDIRTRLSEFKERRARLAVLENELRWQRVQIERAEQEQPKPAYEPPLLPIATTGARNHSTGARILYGTLESLDIEPPQLGAMRIEAEKTKRERDRVEIEVQRMDAALSGLTEKQRLVIELTYMEQMSVDAVARRFDQRFQYYPSRRSISTMRTKGLQILERVLIRST